jgi:hypothetical protein
MEVLNTLEDAVQERIAEVAYGMAESRGFISGQEQQDWQNAQQQVTGEALADLSAIRSGTCQCITHLEQALHQRINEVAYNNAQARGFAPGHELDDWRGAEDQVAVELVAMLPGHTAEQPSPAGVEIPASHNAVEQGWENPAEVEIPAMNPD